MALFAVMHDAFGRSVDDWQIVAFPLGPSMFIGGIAAIGQTQISNA
jgi:hypothetical protein